MTKMKKEDFDKLEAARQLPNGTKLGTIDKLVNQRNKFLSRKSICFQNTLWFILFYTYEVQK